MPRSEMVRAFPDTQPRIVASVLSQVADWGQAFSHIFEYQQKAETLGEGVKVAILDSGVDATHPDLIDNMKTCVDFMGDPRPPHGHGTHVAGIIGAADNGIGVVGVAPKCELYSVRVTNADGLTPGDLSVVGSGIEWCIANGMDVINISLGSSVDARSFCYEKIVEAAAKGIIIVAASGNQGSSQTSFPAAYEDVIAVAAMGKDGLLANFSNVGDEVDFVAPGVDIYSTWPGGQYSLESGTCLPDSAVISTPVGPRLLSEIKEGDEVFSCDINNLAVVTNIVERKWETGRKEIYEVKSGNWTLRATGNHPVLVLRIDKTERTQGSGFAKLYSFDWKRVDELTVSDLVVQVHSLDSGENELHDAIPSEEFAQFLGFMIGDGWISSPKSGMYMICFARGDVEYINDEYKKILSSLSTNPVSDTKDRSQAYTFDKRLYYALSHFGLGDGAKMKTVPQEIFLSPPSIKKSFLIGFLDADGTSPKKKSHGPLTLSSSSLELVRGLKHLLASIGVQTGNIYSRFRNCEIEGRQICGWEHQIVINRSEAEVLFSGHGEGGRKTRRVGGGEIGSSSFKALISNSPFRLSRIRSITKVGDDIVFDLMMKNQNFPAFIADGMVVHNSMAAPFISGVVALMLSYHKHPGEHRTPINGYKDVIEHMRRLQPGNLVASSQSGNGIAIVDLAGISAELCDVSKPVEICDKPKILSSWGWTDRLAAFFSNLDFRIGVL